MQQPNWKLRADCPRDEVEALVRDLGLSETLAAVLVRRGYADPGRAREFLAADLPELPVWVTGDPTRLTQVLDNLLASMGQSSASPFVPDTIIVPSVAMRRRAACSHSQGARRARSTTPRSRASRAASAGRRRRSSRSSPRSPLR